MTISEYIKNFIKGWKNVLAVISFCLVLSLAFSLLEPFKYESFSRLIIIYENREAFDPYTTSKSSQYLSDILSRVVKTTSFLNEVANSGYNISDDFGSSEEKRKKAWDKTVSARAAGEGGIIDLSVFHKDKNQAYQISEAINYILKIKHSLYHGGGDNVTIRVIEGPILSNFPAKPNILMNLFLAVLAGFILGANFVYFFPDYKIRLWRKRQKAPESGLIGKNTSAFSTVRPADDFGTPVKRDFDDIELLPSAQGQYNKEVL